MIRILLTCITFFGVSILSLAQGLEPLHNDKGQFGYGNKSTRTFVIKPQWDEARPFNDYGIAIVRKGKNYGLINKDGKPIGKSMGYSVIAPLDGTEYWLVAEGGKMVDNDSKIKNRATLSPFGFKGSLSYLISGAKWGVMKPNGDFIIKPEYQEISSPFNENFLIVQKGNLLGIIDLNNNNLVAPVYDGITPINNQGLLALRNKKSRNWVLMDAKGNLIIDDKNKISNIYQFNEDYWGSLNAVTADSVIANRLKYKNSSYHMPIMKWGMSWIDTSHPYIAAFKQNKKKTEFGIFDLNGNEVLPFSEGMAYATVPSEGIAIGFKEDKKGKTFGFYDINTGAFTEVPERNYLPFKEGRSLSFAGDQTDFYLVDKNGKKVSQSFDGVTLSEDRFIITNGEKYGLITLQGETIFPSENQGIFDAGQGYFGVLDNQGNFGYFDKDGKNIIPAIYNSGTGFVGDYAAVMKIENGSEKTGVIDKKNRIIVPIIYERTIIGNDKNGQPCFWIFKDGVFNEYNIHTKRFTPSRYVDMTVTPYGTLTKSATENYGLVIGNQEIIPPVLNSPEAVANLFTFMSINDMSQISPLQARTLSIRLNPETNKFKLSDKIDNDYWDY